ncbi:PA0069 family radical SAM protein [Muriicola sp. E247]|uniref:PA0069 family radical SAM protein n=1 Tax=Muriicola sp. E247 TaxID=3242730 RepID=UPI0035241F50
MSSKHLKGRGAQHNSHNKFEALHSEWRDDFLEYCLKEGELADNNKTAYLPIFPKTIVNKVTSPDVGMSYSMNPYQGCEHGCIYCYARNTHEYWGYSAGLDFERKILIKENAPALLESKLKSNTWKAKTIVLSGNTDCYQPAEKKYRITRACLEVFLKYRHPVGIITKNALLLRDLDLLIQLNKYGLIGVHISVTSLSEDTRRLLEPRTATLSRRLKTIRVLSENMIPVNAMLAPLIPGINSHELMSLAKTVSECGARSFVYTVVRLNGAIGILFSDWIRRTMPDKAEKVLNQIRSCHGGSLNDSRFGIRNRGEGPLAKNLKNVARIAKQKYFKEKNFPELNTALHEQYKEGQLKLF